MCVCVLAQLCVCMCLRLYLCVRCAAGVCVQVGYLSAHSLSPSECEPLSHLLNEIRIWGGGGVTTTDKVH